MSVPRSWAVAVAAAAMSAVAWGVIARDPMLGLAIFVIAFTVNAPSGEPFGRQFERAYLCGVGLALAQHLIGHASHP